MKARVLAVVFLCLCVLVFLGCAGFSKKGVLPRVSSLLEPSSMVKFSDVPVPVGFRFLAGDSYSFESSGVRVGVLKYQGKVNPDRVVNFYKEQMPMYNWVLLNVVEYGDRLLNFERENESCIVGLLPKGKTVIITISLGPKTQILPRRSKELIK